jgi:hypothetical protein
LHPTFELSNLQKNTCVRYISKMHLTLMCVIKCVRKRHIYVYVRINNYCVLFRLCCYVSLIFNKIGEEWVSRVFNFYFEPSTEGCNYNVYTLSIYYARVEIITHCQYRYSARLEYHFMKSKFWSFNEFRESLKYHLPTSFIAFVPHPFDSTFQG